MREIHPDLAIRVRNNPPAAGVIVEALKVVNEDVRNRKDQWATADGWPIAGVTATDDGRLVFTPTVVTKIGHGVQDGFVTDLNNATPFFVAQVTWSGTDPRDIALLNFKAYLHPRVNGGNPREVVTWRCQLRQLQEIRNPGEAGQTLVLAAITSFINVGPVVSDTAGVITFDFVPHVNRPRPKASGGPINGGSDFPDPITYAFIWGLDANGDPAANVGWGRDSAQTSPVSSGGNTLEQTQLLLDDPDQNAYVVGAPPNKVLYCSFQTGTFVEKIVPFTAAGNRLNLTAAPTNDVEMVLQAATPDDSSVTAQISDNLVTPSWVDFVDGDLVGVDNTPNGGKDLSGVTKQQEYLLRLTLTPNTGLDLGPEVLDAGCHEVKITDLQGLATVRNVQWSLDPFDLKGEIAEATIEVIRDGVKDFKDPMADILATTDIEDISFRVWVGHADLARNKWAHIETFPYIDDYDPRENKFVFTVHSAMVLVRQALPVPSGSAPVTRAILEYLNQTPKAVFDSIMDSKVALAGRFRGQGPLDTSVTISKRIEDSDAKDELDAVCYIAGGGLITSGGRIKFVSLFAEDSVVAFFPSSEISVVEVTPGLSQRVPELFLRYKYDFDVRDYGSEWKAINQTAINALGVGRLINPSFVDDIIGQWVDTDALAQTLVGESGGNRGALAFGTGKRIWRFKAMYSYPELEIGDLVAVETSAFVARDPVGGREIRGQLWVVARVVGIGDAMRQNLAVWVKDLSDIQVVNETVDRIRTNGPDATQITSGDVIVRSQQNLGTVKVTVDLTGVGGVGTREVRLYMDATTGFTADITTLVGGPIAIRPGSDQTVLFTVTPRCNWRDGTFTKVGVLDQLSDLLNDSEQFSSEFATGQIRPAVPDEFGVHACAIAVYPFHDGAGLTIEDISGNELDLTNAGTAKWDESTMGTVHDFDTAVELRATHATKFDIGGSQDFTLDVILEHHGDGQLILHDKDYSLAFASTGQIELMVRDHWVSNLFAVDYDHLWAGMTALTHTDMYLFTITYDASASLATLYLNGEQIETITLTGAATSDTISDNLDIGNDAATSEFNGFMRYVRIIKGLQVDFPLLTTVQRQPGTQELSYTLLTNGSIGFIPGGRRYFHARMANGPGNPSGTGVDLPPAELCKGKYIRITRTDTTANSMRTAKHAGGSALIDGSGSIQHTKQWHSANLASDGTDWYTDISPLFT